MGLLVTVKNTVSGSYIWIAGVWLLGLLTVVGGRVIAFVRGTSFQPNPTSGTVATISAWVQKYFLPLAALFIFLTVVAFWDKIKSIGQGGASY